jgi:anti-sigma regulatory factor (Ser/Thr protein kinase)
LTTIELRGGPAAIGAARRAIEKVADQESLPRVDDLRLLVSELVTNSVMHGRAGPDDLVRLNVACPNGCVRVEVCDEGPGWGASRRSTALESDDPAGGWGLMLVGALADRWGFEDGDSTCVWFELEVRKQVAGSRSQG